MQSTNAASFSEALRTPRSLRCMLDVGRPGPSVNRTYCPFPDSIRWIVFSTIDASMVNEKCRR